MTRIAVFTPTVRYGGLDVVADGLRRQVLPEGAEFFWLIVDSCPTSRSIEVSRGYKGDSAYVHCPLDPTKPDESSLCKACNHAVSVARNLECDLLVSVHDYTWIPADGLARFVSACPTDAILAGVCHHTLQPGKEAVTDPKGLFSVFAEPYHCDTQPPISWHDCRCSPGEGVRQSGVIEWEPPWACIGKKALYDERLYFDEIFDKAFRYENQDFAARAKALGYKVLVDSNNAAVQLPHWDYFPTEYAGHNSKQDINRNLVKERWGV